MPRRHLPVLALLAGLGVASAVPAQTPGSPPPLTITLPHDAESRLVSVVVTPGLASNATLPEDLKAVRTAMLAGEETSPDMLRALADRRDGLAAQRYVRYLQSLSPPASDSDIAYYASIAVGTGRIWTLPDAIAAMHRLDPATEPSDRKRLYMAMLYPHAWAGNGPALDAVIALNGEGRLFGPLSDATLGKILVQDEKNGDGRAALQLAVNLLGQDPVTTEERAQAIDYLGRAAAADDLQVSVTAANLLALVTAEESTVVSQ
jgi:hypothetical protein